MGLGSSNDFTDSYVLHYPKFCDNRLYVYFPERDKFYTFSIFQHGKKFKFYAQATISIPNEGIFLIGGQTVDDPLNEDDSPVTMEEASSRLSITNFVGKIDLKKQQNFRVDLDDASPCQNLPEPRYLHALVYSSPYIYVIGGEIAGKGLTQSCLRFHTKKKTWENISDISRNASLVEPCGIAIKDSIYVFDTAAKGSNFPKVYKYYIELDQWMEIFLHPRNKDLVIPPTLSSSAYQISDKQILILSGIKSDKEDKDKRGFWYVFDSLTEEIREFNYQEGISHWRKETQGNLDYEDLAMVYARVGDRSVKAFGKRGKRWVDMKLMPESNLYNNPVGCCSRKR